MALLHPLEAQAQMAKKLSFPKKKIDILLLEGIHPVAREWFADAGYNAELSGKAMSEDELIERIPDLHMLGIRSKTDVTERVLRAWRTAGIALPSVAARAA